MKKLFTMALVLLMAAPAWAQGADSGEAPLSLNVYIPDDSGLPAGSQKIMEAKLAAAATANGFGGNGGDNRFVIVPRVEVINESKTETVPQKTSVDVMVHLYVGDGVSGNLFSSESFELKGVGSGRQQAYDSALRKLQPRNSELQAMLAVGRERIYQYYNAQYPAIIKEAKAAYAEGNQDMALSLLYTIPPSCKGHGEAMDLASKWGGEIVENNNNAILAQARAAWSASPDEVGADKAMELIGQIDPSSSAFAGAKTLSNEIKNRMQAVNDREWKHQLDLEAKEHQLAMTRENNRSAERKASIKAAGEVAKAYASRPVYHIHWW